MRQRKGQSATEYLMTYGWAVLAIVVVAGVMWNMGFFGGGYEPSEIIEPEYLQLKADEWSEVCVEYENEYIFRYRVITVFVFSEGYCRTGDGVCQGRMFPDGRHLRDRE